MTRSIPRKRALRTFNNKQRSMGNHHDESDPWSTLEHISSVFTKVFLPIAVVVLGFIVDSGLKERELSKEWVNLAVNVLSNEDFEEEEAMRLWAVNMINHYVDDKNLEISDELKTELVRGNVSIPAPATATIADDTPFESYVTSAIAEGQSVTAVVQTRQRNLNVRAGPSSRFRRLTALEKGDSVEVLTVDGKWAKIRLPEGQGDGWVFVRYLELNKSPANPAQ